MKFKQDALAPQQPPRSNILGALAAFVAFSLFFITGCGDTFRPIANPLPKPSPDPSELHIAVIIFSGGQGASGTSTQVNVAGDTITGQFPIGVDPISASIDVSRVISVNRGDGSLSTYATLAGNFSSSAAAPPLITTISLPGDAAPMFALSAASNIYVAFSASSHNSVGIVNSSNVFTGEVPIGASPVALVALPNGSKVYSINSGSNNVSVINTSDNSLGATIPVGTNPVWGVASPDSARIFIVNQGSGNVSVIENDAVSATIPVGASPNYAIFDARLNRVYVINSGSNTLSIIDADPNSPTLKTKIAEVALQGTTPVSAAALPNGSRVYVANSGSDSVSVVNTLSNQVKTISLGTGAHPFSIAASPDGSKVVVANKGDASHASSVSIISTATDTEAMRIPAPPIDPACTGSTCARQTAVTVGVI